MKNKLILALALFTAFSCTKISGTATGVKSDYVGVVSVDYDGDTFDNPDIKVSYTSSEDGLTADITIYKIKFVPKMPVRIDVTIPAVPVTVTDGGTFFSGTDIIPLALGGEYPKYRVTNLSGNIKGNTLSFSLNFGDYPTRYTGTAEVLTN